MSIDVNLSLDPYGATRGVAHPHPQYDFLTGFSPRKLKDLFRWAEYLGTNSAHIYGTVRKFGEYPISGLTFETPSDDARERHRRFFEDQLRLKSFLTEASFDAWVYGNCFVSLYEPFKRTLSCPHCSTTEDITAAEYAFKLDDCSFTHNCRHCRRQNVRSIRQETALRDPEGLKLRRWDPKLIDIEMNPISGETEYYYTIPRSDIASVRAGNKLFINHTPIEFLSAMREQKIFKFARKAIFHLRMPALSGTQSQWGHPPLVAAIKLFMFAAVLRRANEAIALEYLTPFRVIHPMAASGAGDPLTTINLDRFKREFEQNYRQFRRDPLRFMYSPIPVGVQNVGGDGRALLTLGELQEAEKAIVLALGVPMEFLSGGLGQTRGEITLRIIENQLRTHIENLNDLVRWVEEKATAYLRWSSIPTKLTDFKMVDDVESKQVKLQMWSQGILSNTTIAKTVDIDLARERAQMKQEALDDARSKAETEIAVQKQQRSLSLSAQQQALSAANPATYNPLQVVANNQPLAEELASMDPGTRASRLDALQGEDFVAYAVVSKLLEQMQQDQNAAMKAQMRGGV